MQSADVLVFPRLRRPQSVKPNYRSGLPLLVQGEHTWKHCQRKPGFDEGAENSATDVRSSRGPRQLPVNPYSGWLANFLNLSSSSIRVKLADSGYMRLESFARRTERGQYSGIVLLLSFLSSSGFFRRNKDRNPDAIGATHAPGFCRHRSET